MSIDKASYMPRYYQLKEILESQISDGSLKAGDKFPSERELASQYNLSRFTVVKAISLLTEQGLIERKHGIGTFVSGTPEEQKDLKTHVIGLVLPDFESSRFSRVTNGIEAVMKENNYKLLVQKLTKERSGKIDLSLFEEKIDGLLIIPETGTLDKSYLWNLEKSGIPFVFIDNLPAPSDLDTVSGNDFSGAYKAVEYLISLGHRKISIIINEPDCQAVKERLGGYKKALKDHNIELDRKFIINPKTKPWQCSWNAGYQAMKKVIRLTPRPTAVFAVSDAGAIGALKTVREKNLKVPEDISVIGYDNSAMSEYTDPPLTTIESPSDKMGEEAAKLLLQKIKSGNSHKSQHLILDNKLIVRESCIKVKEFCEI